MECDRCAAFIPASHCTQSNELPGEETIPVPASQAPTRFLLLAPVVQSDDGSYGLSTDGTVSLTKAD